MVVFSYQRKEMLAQTIADLKTHEPALRILVVDNGSTDGTQDMLAAMLGDGRVDKLLLNRHEQVPQWQKGFALAQALGLLSLEPMDYLAWIDDDMRVNRPFVRSCANVLEKLQARKVRLVSLLVDDMQSRSHPPLETLVLDEIEVQIKESFNGAFVFAPVAFFAEFGLPPMGQGVNDVCIEDSYYSRLLQASGGLVAAIDASTHLGYRQSHRRPINVR
ncbi:MAG: glycosyltransferase family 2 protein [Armatimonadetes bacterium]|nr:glycosyltransferase family 2 protein [Armatimonadota bacterium]